LTGKALVCLVFRADDGASVCSLCAHTPECVFLENVCDGTRM
jgi:hypothetical protein